MKLLFFFLFFLCSCSYAQLGIKAGLNTSYFDKYHNYESGFVGGFYDRIGKGWFSVQSEILYEHKGAHNNKADWNFNTYYGQINLIGSINIGSVSLQGGGYASRLLFASNSRFYRRTFSWPVEQWIYNVFDYGWLAGTEVDLSGASVGFRYEHGLRQVVNDKTSTTGLYGARNVCMNVYLSVPFKR